MLYSPTCLQGQPRGITKVAFVNRWPLFRNIYIQLMLLNMLQSLLNLSDTQNDPCTFKGQTF